MNSSLSAKINWVGSPCTNPDFDLCRSLFSPEIARKARCFHRQIPDFRMSPLLALPNLAQMLGVSGIWVKDESVRLQLNSFKVLGGGFLWLLGWLALILLKKEGMGGGDVKLLAAFGAWAGWKVVLGTVVVASFLGATFGILGIIYRKIRYGAEYKPLSHMIPFGPYLCVAFLFIFYCGLDPLFRLMEIYNGWLLGTN